MQSEDISLWCIIWRHGDGSGIIKIFGPYKTKEHAERVRIKFQHWDGISGVLESEPLAKLDI